MRTLVFAMTASAMTAAATLAHAQTAATPPPQPATVSASVHVGTPPPPPPPEPDTSARPGSTFDKTLTLFGAIGYGYGFGPGVGVGARYQWTVAPKGFLRRLPNGMHDEFAIEPGFDYFHAGYSVGLPGDRIDVNYNEFTPLVGFVWNFWLNDKFVVYPKVDIGYRIFSWSESFNGATVSTFQPDYFPVYFQCAAGASYRFGNVSIRAEVGLEALRVGVALSL